jgi:hypothetical protein
MCYRYSYKTAPLKTSPAILLSILSFQTYILKRIYWWWIYSTVYEKCIFICHCQDETPPAPKIIPAVYPPEEEIADAEGAPSSPARGPNSGGAVCADAAGGVRVGGGGGKAIKQALPSCLPWRSSSPPGSYPIPAPIHAAIIISLC